MNLAPLKRHANWKYWVFKMFLFNFFLCIYYLFYFLELPKIIGKLDNLTVNEGQEAKFCVKFIGGNPRPQIKWFKENDEIFLSDEYQFADSEDSFQLVIQNANRHNSGDFYAQLFSAVGTVNSNKSQLVVNCKLF